MEELNKTQVILLALLISFVTSIATGIATVSLIEKAPADVTRVINRIVEKPSEILSPEPEVIVRTEQVPQVIKEDDAIVESISTVSESLVRIFTPERTEAGQTIPPEFLGVGVVMSADGTIATSPAVVNERDEYEVVFADGTIFTAKNKTAQTLTGVRLLTLRIVLDESGEAPKLVPVTFGKDADLKLGQTVIGLGGENTTRVALGNITSLPTTPDVKEGISRYRRINTSIDTLNAAPGMPLSNIFGEVIGIAVPNESGAFIPLTALGSVAGTSTTVAAE